MRPSKNSACVRTLPSGLRLAACRWPGAAVEYCGVAVRAGSRDDGPLHPGLAHFVEHTIFKGTARRSSWHIINRMERVGGELNAYTTKEETVVYTAAPAGNLLRAMDLIADLITSSRFPEAELDKERDVVVDEINSYLDSPADAVYDDFEDLLFAGSPLGHNILGDARALETFDSALCRDYLAKWYTVGNIAVFYCGPASVDRVAAVVESAFAGLSAESSESHRDKSEIVVNEPFDVTKEIGIHQSHTVMGARIAGMGSPNRYAMALLTNMLGGPGMNSLLNIALREKRGLVYNVEANTSLFTDCGEFAIYFGCDHADTARCKELVRSQIESLQLHGVSATALRAAKKQYIGQLAVGSDNRESASIGIGRAALFFGEVLPPAEVAARINAVTLDSLRSCAASLLPLSSLTLA